MNRTLELLKQLNLVVVGTGRHLETTTNENATLLKNIHQNAAFLKCSILIGGDVLVLDTDPWLQRGFEIIR